MTHTASKSQASLNGRKILGQMQNTSTYYRADDTTGHTELRTVATGYLTGETEDGLRGKIADMEALQGDVVHDLVTYHGTEYRVICKVVKIEPQLIGRKTGTGLFFVPYWMLFGHQ